MSCFHQKIKTINITFFIWNFKLCFLHSFHLWFEWFWNPKLPSIWFWCLDVIDFKSLSLNYWSHNLRISFQILSMGFYLEFGGHKFCLQMINFLVLKALNSIRINRCMKYLIVLSKDTKQGFGCIFNDFPITHACYVFVVLSEWRMSRVVLHKSINSWWVIYIVFFSLWSERLKFLLVPNYKNCYIIDHVL